VWLPWGDLREALEFVYFLNYLRPVCQCQPVNTAVRPAGAARPASVREHNLALVLHEIAAATAPPSRADVSAGTGLTRATVSALVDELLAGRLLTEIERAPRAGAGRPAKGLVLAAGGGAGIGLEVNVDYVSACLVDLTGGLRHRTVRAADLRVVSPRQALAAVADLAAAARTEAVRQGLRVAGTALAVPGLVTPAGLVRLAPNLGWRDVDAAGLLAGFGLAGPLQSAGIVIDNEANLAALGELHAGPDARATFLYVSGEIGVGAGIVLDGVLFRGARGWSGEIGHVPVAADGSPCRCGARGCLEQLAGLEALAIGAGLPASALPPDQAVLRIAQRARRGDPSALGALDRAAHALGVGLSAVVNLLDIDHVVLGGVYGPLADWLRPTIGREINSRVLTAAWSPVAVRPARLGPEAAVVGAAGSVVRAILDRPAEWLVADR
jgi:predicted NBD/HSP70 family sugar kinase